MSFSRANSLYRPVGRRAGGVGGPGGGPHGWIAGSTSLLHDRDSDSLAISAFRPRITDYGKHDGLPTRAGGGLDHHDDLTRRSPADASDSEAAAAGPADCSTS